MGMDYKWSGSASYPRFDRELCSVVTACGGIATAHLERLKETEHDRPFGYWFGFLSSDDSSTARFAFPEETNAIVVKWFNNIYGELTAEETKVVWDYISRHPEIEDISRQIWNELKTSVELHEGWDISR